MAIELYKYKLKISVIFNLYEKSQEFEARNKNET